MKNDNQKGRFDIGLSAPPSMSGIYVRAWNGERIFGVAAMWHRENCPVLSYDDSLGSWRTFPFSPYMVLDFDSDKKLALKKIIEHTMGPTHVFSGGELPLLLDKAIELWDFEVAQIADVLLDYDNSFAGDCLHDKAQEWANAGMTSCEVDDWCSIGIPFDVAYELQMDGIGPEDFEELEQESINLLCSDYLKLLKEAGKKRFEASKLINAKLATNKKARIDSPPLGIG